MEWLYISILQIRNIININDADSFDIGTIIIKMSQIQVIIIEL